VTDLDCLAREVGQREWRHRRSKTGQRGHALVFPWRGPHCTAAWLDLSSRIHGKPGEVTGAQRDRDEQVATILLNRLSDPQRQGRTDCHAGASTRELAR